MNGWAALVVCAALAVHLAGRVLAALSAKWDADRRASQGQADATRTVSERAVAVEERRITLEERRYEPRKKAEPMPPDLRGRVSAYEDEWARNDEEATLRQLYAEFEDWDTVRQHLKPLQSLGNGDEPFTSRDREFVR